MPYYFECETCRAVTGLPGPESPPADRVCATCGTPGCVQCMPDPEPRCAECVHQTETAR